MSPLRAAATTFFTYGPIGPAIHLSSTAAVPRSNAALSTVSMRTPLAFSSAMSLSSDSCDSLRCSAVASAAASRTAFRSASDSLSQLRLLIRNGVISYLWPVSEMNFCTSYSLLAWMFISGFSCPSTTPCCSAT